MTPFSGVMAHLVVIYHDTLEEHIKGVKLVIDILRREKFYLAADKLHFMPKELKLLGHYISQNSIKMDPHKVDNIMAWKTPTNRDLLSGFVGAAGYLADGAEACRIPMGVLTKMTGSAVSFRWGPTEQRAFKQVKEIIASHRNIHRVPMDYGLSADPVFLVTDGCSSGIGGEIVQGKTWNTAKVIAFYSAKLSPAQQNYAVHEIELLAGLEQ
jgi:hypothetical protein